MGVDASADNIVVAKKHLRQDPFLVDKVDYRAVPAEILAEAGEKFDVVIGSEIIEHVSDPKAFVAACSDLLRVRSFNPHSGQGLFAHPSPVVFDPVGKAWRGFHGVHH